jgi:hypothetical protein
LDLYPGVVAGWVHFTRRREKNVVGMAQVQHGEIARIVPRIAVKVLTGTELGGVNEDTDYCEIIGLARTPDQGQVPFVEIAHSRDKAHGPFQITADFLHFCHSLDYLHVFSSWAFFFTRHSLDVDAIQPGRNDTIILNVKICSGLIV